MERSEPGPEELDALDDFRRHAAAYCHAIESYEEHSEEDFLRNMATLLAGLYASASRLKPDYSPPDHDSPHLWHYVFDKLEPFLVKSDQYRKVLTSYPESNEEEQVIEGCLANDLSSIYAYLRPLPDSHDAKPAQATIKEGTAFTHHKVGEDVVNALLAIHAALYDDFLFEDDE